MICADRVSWADPWLHRTSVATGTPDAAASGRRHLPRPAIHGNAEIAIFSTITPALGRGASWRAPRSGMMTILELPSSHAIFAFLDGCRMGQTSDRALLLWWSGRNQTARFCCRFAADAATRNQRDKLLLWFGAAHRPRLGVRAVMARRDPSTLSYRLRPQPRVALAAGVPACIFFCKNRRELGSPRPSARIEGQRLGSIMSGPGASRRSPPAVGKAARSHHIHRRCRRWAFASDGPDRGNS